MRTPVAGTRPRTGSPRRTASRAVRNRTRVGCSKAFSTRTTGRLRRNRDATPLALPHTRSYGGCRSEGGSNAHAGVVDRRPVARTGRRVRRRIHAPGPRQRNHRDTIALVEHGALDCDCSWGRLSCAGADLPPATDGLLTGTNSTVRRVQEPDTGRSPLALRATPARRSAPMRRLSATSHVGPRGSVEVWMVLRPVATSEGLRVPSLGGSY
jgi:hypothetical protein